MDKIPLNSHQVLAFLFPGFLFAMPAIYCYYYSFVEQKSIEEFVKHYKDYAAMVIVAFIALSTLGGLIFDSIRNGIFEGWFDKKKTINWKFFFERDSEKVGMLYARYYNYYVCDVNTIISILFSWIVLIISLHFADLIIFLLIEAAIVAILWREAFVLRGEISHITHTLK